MIRLAPFDRDADHRRPDRALLRPLPYADPRPVRFVFADHAGADRTLAWPADLDALAGTAVDLLPPGPFDRLGLPRVRVGPDALCSVHPEWLGPLPDPAGAPCVCDDRDLFYQGCRCGRMARERAAA